MVSSYRRSFSSAANSSGCLFGKAAHSPGFVPVWCLPEQESLERDEPPGSCCHCYAVSLKRRAAICIRSRCLTRLVFASEGRLVTRKVNSSRSLQKVTANISSTFCTLQGSTDSVCGLSTSSALVSHVHLRPHGDPRVNRSRSAAPGCGQYTQKTDRQCYFIDIDSQKMHLYFFYTMVQKVKNDQKLKSRGPAAADSINHSGFDRIGESLPYNLSPDL